MTGRSYTLGEIAVKGKAIYREGIQAEVEPGKKGSFVVIDVETGDYEVDAGDAAATRRLLQRRPTAVTYGIRVGHRAAYSHVGGFLMPNPYASGEGKRGSTGTGTGHC